MNKDNKMQIDGNGNITLQDVNGSTITVNVNDTEKLSTLFKTLESNISQNLKEYIEDHNHSTYPHELTAIPRIDITDLIGRDAELDVLFEHLFSYKKTVVVNGLGGIGKTVLAQAYMSKYYDDYQHLVWVSQTGKDAARAFLDNNDLLENLKIDISKIDEKDRLGTILNKQRTIEKKPNLLVIDNADQTICNFHQLLPGHPNWHVLVTSREKLEPFEIIELDFLNHEKALQLFKKHCFRINDDCEIGNLLKIVEYHTLTIEILAKTAQLHRTPIDKLKIAIETDLKANVAINHFGKKIEKVTSYLSSIFNFSPLTEHQQWLMKQFCFLPPDYHTYESLCDLLTVESLTWCDDFSEIIETLCSKGWLLKNSETDSYKMHRIIIDITFEQLKPKYKEIKPLVDKISDLLYIEEDVDDFLPKIKWIPYGETILNNIEKHNIIGEIDDNTNFAFLLKNLGWVHKEFGNMVIAKRLISQAMQFGSIETNCKNSFTADCHSKLGIICVELYENDEALRLCLQAVQIDKEINQNKTSEYALHLNNLGCIYKDIANFEMAKSLLEESLALRISIFGEISKPVAVCLYNLAETYREMSVNEMAKELLEKSISIRLHFSEEKHPAIAYIQNSLAIVLQNLGELEKAKKLLEFALQVDLDYYNPNNPEIAKKKNNLASIYYDLGDYQKAILFEESAYKIWLEAFGEEHIYTKYAKQSHDFYKKFNNNLVYKLREDALNHFHNEKFDEAENLIKKALGYNIELAGLQCHLARIYICTDRIIEAQKAVEFAWQNYKEASDYTITRIRYFQLIFSIIQSNEISLAVSNLKESFLSHNAFAEWSIDKMLVKLSPYVNEHYFNFLKVISTVINTPKDIYKLNEYIEWKDSK